MIGLAQDQSGAAAITQGRERGWRWGRTALAPTRDVRAQPDDQKPGHLAVARLRMASETE